MSKPEETYSTGEAAKVLGMTPRRVQQLIKDEALVGRRGAGRTWRVDQRSVHDYLREHGPTKPRVSRPEGPSVDSEYLDRVAALERELGRLQGRLEITEKAESSMVEERDRLLSDLERERERLQAAEERAEGLQRELDEARKSWWDRLLGR